MSITFRKSLIIADVQICQISFCGLLARFAKGLTINGPGLLRDFSGSKEAAGFHKQVLKLGSPCLSSPISAAQPVGNYA